MPPPPEILVVDRPVDERTLRQVAERTFGDMVKVVVDVERGVIALGGELHADGEALLLEQGSRQADLWGANYYPDREIEQRIEFTALINIRPGQGNRGMEVEDASLRARMREITLELLVGAEG